MTEESTWDTDEVHRWIANDEWSYTRMLECEDRSELRQMFEFRPIPGVDWDQVDWDQIWDWFEEDRRGL